MNEKPLVTIVVPSFNQGSFLNDALSSIFEQNLPIEVFVCDGGSTDNSLEIIRKWEHMLSGWRSHEDQGQAAAINEGVKEGSAPYVCWLNSDDWYLPNGLATLFTEIEKDSNISVVYGKVWNINERTAVKKAVWIESFDECRLASRCIISQPATLIRRAIWEEVGGLDESLDMAMDYDLWWRIYRLRGSLRLVDKFVAINRVHQKTKTNSQRFKHYKEAISVVQKHYGRVPLKWWWAQPYAVWYQTIKHKLPPF